MYIPIYLHFLLLTPCSSTLPDCVRLLISRRELALYMYNIDLSIITRRSSAILPVSCYGTVFPTKNSWRKPESTQIPCGIFR